MGFPRLSAPRPSPISPDCRARVLEDVTAAAKAVAWMRRGVDFADGLHLAKAEGCEAFISFDQDFAKAAKTLGSIKVRRP